MLGQAQKNSIVECHKQIAWVKGRTVVDNDVKTDPNDVIYMLERGLQSDLSEDQVRQMLADYRQAALNAKDEEGYRPLCHFHITTEPVGQLGVRWSV